MKTLLKSLLFCASGVLAGCSGASEQESLTAYVNTSIGTGGHGHVFVGANVPFGFVQLGPTSIPQEWDWCSGYHESDSTVIGFSHTHLSGTGIGDLFDITVMPVTGDVTYARGTEDDQTSGLWSYADRTQEVSRPGYYKVPLVRYGVTAEMTATARVGLHRYTFPASEEAALVFDLQNGGCWDAATKTEMKASGNTRVEGCRFSKGWASDQRVYFVAEFSKPFDSFTLAGPDDMYGRASFKTGEGEQVLLKVALSPVSIEGARKNLEAELPGWDFEAVCQESSDIWNDELNKIQIETSDPVVRKNFYTALYHASLAPYAYQDVDGQYAGLDKKVHTAAAGYMNYTAFSLWDTFRALHPLLTIIRPERATAMGLSLVQAYREGTILPKWPIVTSYTGCMPAYHSVSVLADLVCKGLTGDDDLKVWAEAGARSSVYRADLAEKFKGTREMDLITKHLYYKDKYGFVPADSIPESVSWGLEMAYDDWCIAQIAKAAGDQALADEYMKKADYYKRYLDPETKFMRPIMSDGSFRTPFNPRYSSHMKSDYTEGNAFQWSFFAPHDMDNFIAAIGGKKELETRLDTLFTTSSQIDGAEASGDITGLIGQYAHGNEPSHHMAYLYNWTDAPWKGQERLDFIMRNFYTNQPDGIIGNEDCGQMSAWYVMSAMGFYQVCPGIPVYTVGRPMVDKATIRVAGGTFEIVVTNNSPENKYVKSIKLNGQELATPFFSHADLVKGGKMEIEMSATH